MRGQNDEGEDILGDYIYIKSRLPAGHIFWCTSCIPAELVPKDIDCEFRSFPRRSCLDLVPLGQELHAPPSHSPGLDYLRMISGYFVSEYDEVAQQYREIMERQNSEQDLDDFVNRRREIVACIAKVSA